MQPCRKNKVKQFIACGHTVITQFLQILNHMYNTAPADESSAPADESIVPADQFTALRMNPTAAADESTATADEPKPRRRRSSSS
jgi:hypothetical protein